MSNIVTICLFNISIQTPDINHAFFQIVHNNTGEEISPVEEEMKSLIKLCDVIQAAGVTLCASQISMTY